MLCREMKGYSPLWCILSDPNTLWTPSTCYFGSICKYNNLELMFENYYTYLEISEIYKAHFQNVWGTSLKDGTWSLTPEGLQPEKYHWDLNNIPTLTCVQTVSKLILKKKKKKKTWALTIHSDSNRLLDVRIIK